jgi:phosphoglycerate dehydrogenase-like enzyme
MKTYLVGANKEFLENIQDALNSSGIENTHIIVSKEIAPKELKEKASDGEILVASPSAFKILTKEHLEQMPKLKLITTTSVGTEWIDVKAATDKNIIVSNEKGVNSESVAEHCFGMILDLSKLITEADRNIREGGDQKKEYLGFEIYGKTLGIIGLGDIGTRVARIAHGFDMRVIGVNKNKKEVSGVDLVEQDILLKESDIIVVAVPLTNETDNLLSSKEFSFMKKGVILVSISREKVVNKEAVLEALNKGDLAGFGFDAEIAVPIAKDDPWFKSEHVIITPHSASVTKESHQRYATMTAENINAFLKGEPIRVVNYN